MIDNSTLHLEGYIEDRVGSDNFESKVGSLAQIAPNLMSTSQKDVHLWMALLRCHPKWRRFAQKIGDCFPSGTPILMANGDYKPINKVRIGDVVFTHTNNRCKVENVLHRKFSGTTITIGLSDGYDGLSATVDHKVVRISINNDVEWVAVGDLVVGDKLLIPECASRKVKNKATEQAAMFSQSAGGSSTKTTSSSTKHGSTVEVTSISANEVADFDVYCLHVPLDNSFIVNSIAVHNCVSWGAELATTMLMGILDLLGQIKFDGEAATEPIYGGARVEALHRQTGGWSDGAMGYAAAEWLTTAGGILLRKDYSQITGIKEHDLRVYSGEKAKNFGYYGCGGQQDAGKLDGIAKKSPVGNATRVKTVEELIAAIENGYPVTMASSAGYGTMKRDENGVCKIVNTWAHQMMCGALRWFNGRPQGRIFQSWGDSCSGPDPGIAELVAKALGDDSLIVLPQSVGSVNEMDWKRRLVLPSLDFPYYTKPEDGWNPISACSWWADEADLAWTLKNGDCWALSGVNGFEKKEINWLEAFSTWA